MKIMVLGSISPESVAAIQAEVPAIEITSSNPFFGLATASTSSFDVAVTDFQTAGALPQPFEHLFTQVVVVNAAKGNAELREYQLRVLKATVSQYAIHTERFLAPVSASLDMHAFTRAFARAVNKDPLDVREAVRWGLKASVRMPSSVVQSLPGG